MSDKTISYQTAGNHWYWRAKHTLDCQTGTIVTMPEDGKITGVSLKVAGLDYDDPVYGYQHHEGHMRPAIWDLNTGKVLSTGAYTVLPISTGGSQPWVHFDLTDLQVKNGQSLIVGFWRDSSTTSYATQWDYNDTANGMITLSQSLFGSSTGPFTFSTTDTFHDRSINFILEYVAGGKVKVWAGTRGWISGTANVWDGNNWVPGQAMVWTGSSWVESSE